MVRFLGLKASDGRVRASLDACDICGTFGYIEENKNLVCLNCAAEINPLTLGTGGGCNPIPLKHDVSQTALSVPVPALEGAASQFPAASQQSGKTEIDPVCGMQVKMNEATAFETADGKTYYFCSQRCHGMFLKSRE
jgi:YHS domain-containing protein